MCPPLNRHSALLGDDQWVMILLFGNHRDLTGKRHRFDEVLEFKNAFKPLDPICFFDVLFRYLCLKLSDLSVRQGRLTASASNAFQLG